MAEEEEAERDPFEELSDSNDETDVFDNSGIACIDKACSEVYPDQPNPLQVTAMLKYWLGGPDPMDYISMYENCGEPDIGIPSHWHYVSYGFSDLHGDGRVHSFSGPGNPSGFGFELTFRLVKDVSDTVPPMWPTSLMNKLAKYVFHTGNVLYVGDHIPWHKSLNGAEESHIQHMLVTKDPQLSIIDTPYGFLEFRQIVGVTEDEVKTAQKWKGVGVLELMAGVREIGPYFITDMARQKSIFEIEPSLLGDVLEGIDRDGSNLGHVTAICSWQAYSELEHEKLLECGKHDFSNINSNSADNDEECDACVSIKTLEGIQLWFDAEAAELLPMVVKARLKKGRFFVFHNAKGYAIHLFPPEVEQSEEGAVDDVEPLKAKGSQLKIFCTAELIEHMSHEFEVLQSENKVCVSYPQEFRFSNPRIIITVSPKGEDYSTANL